MVIGTCLNTSTSTVDSYLMTAPAVLWSVSKGLVPPRPTSYDYGMHCFSPRPLQPWFPLDGACASYSL